MTTQQWLDKMVRRFGSQAALARFLKITPGRVSEWRHKRRDPGNKYLAKTGYVWQIGKT